MCRLNFYATQLSQVLADAKARVELFRRLRDSAHFTTSQHAEEYAQLDLQETRCLNRVAFDKTQTQFWVDVPLDLSRGIDALDSHIKEMEAFITTNGDVLTINYIHRNSFDKELNETRRKKELMLTRARQAFDLTTRQ